MNLRQALGHFVSEALRSLVRGWGISLLAVATAATSLVLVGAFVLLSRNGAGLLASWQDEARVTVYLVDGGDQPELTEELSRAEWVAAARWVEGEEMERRVAALFPDLREAVTGGLAEPFPAVIELTVAPGTSEVPAADLNQLMEDPRVEWVDDDLRWVSWVERVLLGLRAALAGLGGLLLCACVFTIASVTRLSFHAHREEVGVLRLVGATEFLVRGPFFVQGFLQGLLGGGVAALLLYAMFRGAQPLLGGHPLVPALLSQFLSWSEVAWLVALGGVAGALGSAASLRREN